MNGVRSPRLRHRFTIRAEVDAYRPVGAVDGGDLVFIPITGGTVSGELEGTVLPGGGDWATFNDDDSVMVEARYQFVTSEGVMVDVVNTGIAQFEGPARERVDYFPTRPVFRVADPSLAHLTRRLYLGWARSAREATEIDVFEVLDPAGD